MILNCILENSEGHKIKKFTATLINESGNTIDRKKTVNGKVNLDATPKDDFVMLTTVENVYTIQYIVIVDSDTTITVNDKVAVNASDIKQGHINIVSLLGDLV